MLLIEFNKAHGCDIKALDYEIGIHKACQNV